MAIAMHYATIINQPIRAGMLPRLVLLHGRSYVYTDSMLIDSRTILTAVTVLV